jgi:hypothetical protein
VVARRPAFLWLGSFVRTVTEGTVWRKYRVRGLGLTLLNSIMVARDAAVSVLGLMGNTLDLRLELDNVPFSPIMSIIGR